MKKFGIVLIAPLVLAACAEPRQPTVERQALKDACLTSDFSACADLGHQARDDMGGATKPAAPQMPLSVPIVD